MLRAQCKAIYCLCDGCKAQEEGGLYRNDFLLLHFKNKLEALSVPRVRIESGSSVLEINVTA